MKTINQELKSMATTTKEYVVLVDEEGTILGTEEKMAAHRKGLLHRAFSIFIFNEEGKMLLQQRATTKYHFGGLWSNSCCSHPRLSESILEAGHRRLQEELGFDAELKEAFTFLYRAEDIRTQLIEHELDTVLLGIYNTQSIFFNPKEVKAVKWVSMSELFQQLEFFPDNFTYWFKAALLEMKNRELLSLQAIQTLLQS